MIRLCVFFHFLNYVPFIIMWEEKRIFIMVVLHLLEEYGQCM